MKEVDNYVTNTRQVSIEALGRRILAQCIFEDCAEKVRHWAQVGGINTNRIEGAAG
jgi:hypothetical protein